MCLRGLTAMTRPCRGRNPGSTPGVGVHTVGRIRERLFVQLLSMFYLKNMALDRI
jgi:hypothetical protein